MIALLQNVTAMGIDKTAPFSVSGGVAPYTWTVLAGGAGGTINSSGLYTSPSRFGVDTIQVTDDDGAIAQASMAVGGPLQLVCDIIQREMNLASGQVYLWDQKVNTPNDNRLYVVVGALTCKPFSSINSQNADGDEIQSTNFQMLASIDIFSRSSIARDRKEEIILALRSQYSEQQQNANSFYIARLSTAFVNLSEVDGAAIPYQFNISVQLQYLVTKTKGADYYDSFSDAVVTSEP